jgi:hypothetical protein
MNMKKTLALLALAATSAFAQTYPAKPIHLVVPFSPGGASDLTARTIAQKMSEGLGQSVVVDNKPGANGVVGIDIAAKAAPDGYTLLLTDRGSLTVNPWLYQKLPYDPIKDFAYVGIITDGPYVLVANPKLGVSTVKELVALSKAKPGTLSYASYGVGSMAQLNLEAFNQKMGTDMLHVPYKGAARQRRLRWPARSASRSPRARRAGLHQGWSPARARGRRRTSVLPCCPTSDDDRGRRRQRHPGADVLRAARACRHAAGDRRELERGDEEGARDPQVVERLAGPGSCRTAARRKRWQRASSRTCRGSRRS